jgi:hypothetical protein
MRPFGLDRGIGVREPGNVTRYRAVEVRRLGRILGAHAGAVRRAEVRGVEPPAIGITARRRVFIALGRLTQIVLVADFEGRALRRFGESKCSSQVR